MNYRKISIGSLLAVLAIGIGGYSVMDLTQSEGNQTLSIALITTEINADRPSPPPITLGEHGDSMTQQAIRSMNNVEFATLDNASEIKMDGKSVDLVDTRLRTNGAVYNYYGVSPVDDSSTLTEFMKSGGIVVKTTTLKTPEVTYATLANHEDTKGQSFVVDGILAYVSEAHDRVPTTLSLYLDDGRVVSVWANASVEDTIKIAKKLELKSELINLNDYVDSNWTDGLERIPAQTEILPEPES